MNINMENDNETETVTGYIYKYMTRSPMRNTLEAPRSLSNNGSDNMNMDTNNTLKGNPQST